MGSVGVGKTSLVERLVYQRFSPEYLSSIGVRVDKKSLELDDCKVNLLIWDIAGEFMTHKVYQKYLRGAAAVVCVFDVTREQSFLAIKSLISEISNEQINPIIYIIGNKIDLVKNKAEFNYLFLDESNVDMLTSAKDGEKVEEAFQFLSKILASNSPNLRRV